ncbi:MAG TPA: VOC family protein [Gemmataceae bacterium]|nr:VOC family protein [Gemmataceae bacterium]
MQKITPCLWFDGNAEEAARFYSAIFQNAQINKIARYGEGGPRPKGSALAVEFQLDGQEFLALNGGPQFTFTEAISFIVNCETQEEVDRMWAKLSEGGEEVQCGWVKDKYGISWQIVPTILGKMMADPDPARAARVLQAMMQMKKLNINELRKAYERQ